MMKPGIHASTVQPDHGGSGLPSLKGYFYQVAVSVLAAIDTLLLKKLTDKLVLEPAGRDDLEADLKHPQAMSAAADISTANCRLIVQAKYATAGPWKQGAFIALLKHGTKRESALTRLKNETVRYLLATSAADADQEDSLVINAAIEKKLGKIAKAKPLPTKTRPS
jgi:hypothetical protein